MQVNIREKEGVVIFDLEGKIIGSDSVELKKVIDERIVASSGAPKFLFNLSGVSMVDSSGLGALIGSHLSVARKGGRIGVINVSTGIRNLLVMARLITVLERFESEAEAIKSLTSS